MPGTWQQTLWEICEECVCRIAVRRLNRSIGAKPQTRTQSSNVVEKISRPKTYRFPQVTGTFNVSELD